MRAETELLEKLEVDSQLGPQHELVLWNDDVNT
jgi:hypothetical protein